MSVPARHRSRRRIAALNFLANISLDGSHRDTKYSIFLKRGLEHVYCTDKTTKRNQAETENQKIFEEVDGNCEIVATRSNDDTNHLLGGCTLNLEATQKSTPSSKRCRISSFSEAKTQPIKERRSLFHTYSISEDTPEIELTSSEHVPNSKTSVHGGRTRNVSSSSSQDSLGSCTKSSHNQSKLIKSVKFASNGEKLQRRDRIILLSGCKHPFAVFSTLPYYKQTKHGLEAQKKKYERYSLIPGANELLYGISQGSDDSHAVSYSELLVPTKKLHPAAKKITSQENHLYPIAENNSSAQSSPAPDAETCIPADQPYDPCLLDDPELQSGKHRTVLTFPSYVTSVIDYAKPSDLKKELNEKFKEMFPHIQLSLTKLRSLKRDMKKIATKCGVDLWTVAQSFVFFEKIILKGLIHKLNRRLVATASLILSAKLNDVKGAELTKLITELEEYFKLNRKDFQRCEFGVLVALEFSLLVPDKEVTHHYQRLSSNS